MRSHRTGSLSATHVTREVTLAGRGIDERSRVHVGTSDDKHVGSNGASDRGNNRELRIILTHLKMRVIHLNHNKQKTERK
jgi:hypothetical protein